jgi:hypothetical protein
VEFTSNLIFVISLVLGSILFFVAQYTFWAFFEILSRVAHLPEGNGFLLPVVTTRGWPNDLAVVPALLASSGAVYLILDRAALVGNDRAKKILREKASRVLGGDLLTPYFFVEARAKSRHVHLPQDLGYLCFYEDRLEFIGDRFHAVIPREQLGGNAVLETNIGKLGAAWLMLPLQAPWGVLRLLARGDAARLSDTDPEARTLQKNINEWLQQS